MIVLGVGWVQTVWRNNSSKIQSDDVQIKDTITCLLTLIPSEEEVGQEGKYIILELQNNVKVNY